MTTDTSRDTDTYYFPPFDAWRRPRPVRQPGRLRRGMARLGWRYRLWRYELWTFGSAVTLGALYVMFAVTDTYVRGGNRVINGILGLTLACFVAGCVGVINRRNDARMQDLYGCANEKTAMITGRVEGAHRQMLDELQALRAEIAELRRKTESVKPSGAGGLDREIIALGNKISAKLNERLR